MEINISAYEILVLKWLSGVGPVKAETKASAIDQIILASVNIRPPDKSVVESYYFYFQANHRLWLLKRTVQVKWFL